MRSVKRIFSRRVLYLARQSDAHSASPNKALQECFCTTPKKGTGFIMLNAEIRHLVKEVTPKLIDKSSKLRLYEITAGDDAENNHIYMETPVFTADCSAFIFKRITQRNYLGTEEDYSQIMLCDITDGFSVRALTDEHRICAV